MTSRRVRNRTIGDPREPRSTSSPNGRNGSGTWMSISAWSQKVNATRWGRVRYRRGFTVTVYPVAVGSPRSTSRIFQAGCDTSVERTAIRPSGRPGASLMLLTATDQSYGPAPAPISSSKAGAGLPVRPDLPYDGANVVRAGTSSRCEPWGEPGPTARSSRGRWPAVIAGRSVVRPRTAEAEGFSSNGKPKSGGTTDPRPDTGQGSFVLPRGGETRGEHGS